MIHSADDKKSGMEKTIPPHITKELRSLKLPVPRMRAEWFLMTTTAQCEHIGTPFMQD